MNKLEVDKQELLANSDRRFADGDYAGAASALQQVLVLDSDNANLWSNLGYTQYLQGRLADSEVSCRKAIALDSNFIAAYSNLSLSLLATGQFDTALETLNTALKIAPMVGDLWVNLGLLYLKTIRITEAIDAFSKAIVLEPNSYIAYTNLALCWQEIGFVEKAYALYQTALTINPNYRATVSNRLMCSQYHGSLSSLQLLQDAQSLITALMPMEAASNARRSDLLPLKRRRRLGFCSADLRAHPVGWFLRDVFAALAEDFDCYCYSNQTEQLDDVSAEFQRRAHRWVNTKGLNTEQLVEQVNEDEIDLLIDLSGHTSGNQLELFAHPSVAKKVSWLGYPATTGLLTIDGVLLSEDLICEATQCFFTEPIIPLAGPQFVYRPPEYLPEVAQAPSLINGYVTFGCFNNLSKLNDSVLCCWARLLHAMPTSRLVLKWKTLGDAAVQERVLKRFHSLGVDASRVELRGASEHSEMLRQYNDIDIALDPFPFSGALTSFESIWMGVPVVTLYSLRPISRQTYSVNKALDLAYLSAKTPSGYVQAAFDLASDIDALAGLRASLRARISASLLCDAGAMSENVAAAITRVLDA